MAMTNAVQAQTFHKKPSTAKSQARYKRAKAIVPGGTQLLSKRPEWYAPNRWPAYFSSAHGCEIVDLDGNTWLDMSLMGIGSCLLGYADPDVTSAVLRRVQAGAMCTLNDPDEVTLAEDLLELHPWAQNVRFARTGGEAMAVAVRIARAATNRDLVAVCGYHGWQDWYLAANRRADGKPDALQGHFLPGLSPAGVPTQLTGTALTFGYNRIDELADIVRQHGSKLAAVVMEPTRSAEPKDGFLDKVRQLCDDTGAVLVVDEITAGWRFALGGAHLKYALEPDIAVFAKALGNGHPMAAIIGRESVMQAAQESFISSTYWTESVGTAAAIATIRKLRRVDVVSHIHAIGMRFRQGLEEIASRTGVRLKLGGHPALTSLIFEYDDAAAMHTLFTERMLDHGILSGIGFYPSWAHSDQHVDQFLSAAEEVFPELALAAAHGDAATRITSEVKHTAFARLA